MLRRNPKESYRSPAQDLFGTRKSIGGTTAGLGNFVSRNTSDGLLLDRVVIAIITVLVGLLLPAV
jgi:hypothetical protein